jgi:hypothetical protein
VSLSNHELSPIHFGDDSTNLLMPQGSNFLLLRQKKSHQRKGDPDDCPDPAMLRKKRNGPKLASLKQFSVLIAFFLRFSGTIHGGPERQIFDRFAMDLQEPGCASLPRATLPVFFIASTGML